MTTVSTPVLPGVLAGAEITRGDRIRITERIVAHDETWLTQVEGEVLSIKMEPTGSWFALGKNDRLWLQRIILRRDDGEIDSLIVDQNMEVEILGKGEKKGQGG